MSLAAFTQYSLAAVVRNLRSAPGGTEEEAVDRYIADTKNEVNAADPRVKMVAIQKATYFHMLGYSSQYADFRVVEMMASPIFLHKRIAYLAACLTFTEDTDVIPLMTASLKRDLSSSNQFEVGLALYCIASICTPDMAQDVVADVVNLLGHPRAYVRKKATLSLYRVFLSYPESLRVTYGRLKEKLEDNNEKADTDPAVRGAVVCVLCELARRNPANFLGLAVPFYSLLSSVHSNWTLIKIVKVFGYFAPLEPRLGKKLVEPITNLINTTGAKSVQYECLLAVANGMSQVSSLKKLAAEKIRGFVEDADPNLKFLGLEALSLLVASSENRKLLADQREVVLRCLDDPDSTIRLKALHLLRDLTTRKTVISHINEMLDRCVRTPPDEEWSNAVIRTIIETAQTGDYEWIQDFEWYLSVLLDLCVVELTVYTHGGFMEQELVCILSRVNGVRRAGVEEIVPLLTNVRLLGCDRQHSTQWRILCAAAFICGEYPHWVPDIAEACRALLDEPITLLPAEVQLACVAAVGKIAAYVYQPCARHVQLCNGEEECRAAEEEEQRIVPSLAELIRTVLLPEADEASGAHDNTAADDARGAAARAHRGLRRFCHSAFPSVLERAHLVQYQVMEHPEVGPKLYEAVLPPVAAGAQDAIELPEDVDLEAPFCENVAMLMALSGSDEDDGSDGGALGGYGGLGDSGDDDLDANFNLEYRIEQQRRSEQARREEMAPYYLRDSADAGVVVSEDFGAPSRPLRSAQQIGCDDGLVSHAGAVSQHRQHTRTRRPQKVFSINRQLSKPADYEEKKAARWHRSKSPEEDEATRKLRGIDVTRALRADERLPETLSYAQLLQQQQHKGKGSDELYADAMVASHAAEAVQVTLYNERPLGLYLTVTGCKVRRDGLHLSGAVECVNATSSSVVRDVRLTATPTAAFAMGDVTLRLEAVKSDMAEDASGGTSVTVAERLKGSATVRVPIVARLSHLPSSFAEAPLSLNLSWTAERKHHQVALTLPLEYVYFAKPVLPGSVLTSHEYLEDVVGKALAAAPIATAFVPCSKAAIMTGVMAAMPQLRLAPIDVFKDALSMYGLLHGRKSELAHTHVAVLLQEQEVDGSKGILVTVRCHYPVLSEALIVKLAELVGAH
ncbi:putative adaptor complex protein (AP) 3 delta subunit 1 [Leishmania infantum JPCM5]|uniref:AP-3 complex subunit delta n=2 Tax=Leishmania infantum TaxID=5671 RepID=A0A6L0WQU9_LEIIN|nr:putative adaptor complex protein (AP) 3 delta subunit 1 [Leishmania infantum JPCM5]CAC9450408.1 adaptor_complex_protein_(AP)_3_delta_subunit_1_-_putative [Leishmania infantum]CAM65708.1 putative adaptor complex protein (AP) 3 delta subunit 1 [Leishmania infantum JPCM5]SUZ39324.1 adaptor_complex_protein_(AP)_3_delta_subunit_1_-_putative [Leishmania infantum]|eukprot:XP_001463350.1 putative adaptor complex protein (AP) 3 delta subunit 1 [Leishmania infantum JPCM5]